VERAAKAEPETSPWQNAFFDLQHGFQRRLCGAFAGILFPGAKAPG
jgi:hypothetical protein